MTIQPSFTRPTPITVPLLTAPYYQHAPTAIQPPFFRPVPVTGYLCVPPSYQNNPTSAPCFLLKTISITDCLFKAVREKNISVLRNLFQDFQANPNCRDQLGKPLLVYAAENRFTEGMLSILQQSGADLNIKDQLGRSALHVTASKGDIVGTRILTETGCYKNIKDENSRTPLHFAVRTGNATIVNYLVNELKQKDKSFDSVDIDPVDSLGRTPLIQACYERNAPLINMLVNAGAQTDRPDSRGFTPKALLTFLELDEQIVSEIPMGPFTTEFMQRKDLAHYNGIEGTSKIGKTAFPLGSHYSNYMHQRMHKQLQQYFQQHRETYLNLHKASILKAFEDAGWKVPDQYLADRIQNGHLVIIAAGWRDHAIDVVFFQNYMAICNRGERIPNDLKNIEVFKVERALVTKEIIAAIHGQYKRGCLHASTYFYFNLPAKLAGTGLNQVVQDDLCRKISEFGPKRIKNKTCTYGAAKAGLLSCILLLEMTHCEKSMYDSVAVFSKEASKMITTLGRINALEEYLDFHFNKARNLRSKKRLDRVLLKGCFLKTAKHVGRTGGEMRQLFQKRIESLERNYPEVSFFRSTR